MSGAWSGRLGGALVGAWTSLLTLVVSGGVMAVFAVLAMVVFDWTGDDEVIAVDVASYVGASLGALGGAAFNALILRRMGSRFALAGLVVVPVLALMAGVGTALSPLASPGVTGLGPLVAWLGVATLAGAALVEEPPPDEDALPRRSAP